MILAADYPLLDIVLTMLVFFAWVIWFWILIVVLSDVFRRPDLSGWGKAGWTLFAIVLPFLGVLSYLVAHGDEMAERRARDIEARPSRVDDPTRKAATANGPATEIANARHLLEIGAIDEDEFSQLKRKALA
jgi:Phospholipase_D-nuclease N-terminal